MLVARRVYWASLEAGLAPGRTGLVAHWFGLVAHWFGLVADLFRRGLRCVYLVARWFGLVAGFLVGGRVWLVAIFGWGLSSGVV